MARDLRGIAMSWLACAGCAQLFGLEVTSGPDAQPVTPAMTLQLENAVIGAAVVRSALDVTGGTATFLIADAAQPGGFQRLAGVLADSKDRWTAEVPIGSTAAVEYTLSDQTYRRLHAFPSRTISDLHITWKNGSPAPSAATLGVKLTLPSGYASNEYFLLYIVGPWGVHQFTGAELPVPDMGVTAVGPVSIPYNTTNFPSQVGPRPLPLVTMQDQIVAERYVGSDLTAAGVIAPFDQNSGGSNVSATLTAVTHTALDVKVQPTTATMRLAGTSPVGGNQSLTWAVTAAPASQFAYTTGPVLQSGSVAATDTAITSPYGSPFATLGWSPVIGWYPQRSRTYNVPALGLPATLYSGLMQIAPPTAGTTLDLSAGLPILVSINGTPLNVDGQTIKLDPAQPVVLSLVADRMPNAFYQWNIYELVPNSAMPATGLDFKAVYVADCLDTSVTIPNDVFVAGKVYTVRAFAIKGGYPAIGTGDLQQRELPYVAGYHDSGVFTVSAL